MSSSALCVLVGLLAAEASPVSTTAPASASSIAIVLPPAPDAPMMEALHRLRGEAMSVGFDVKLVPGTPGARPLDQLGQVAKALVPAAAVAIGEEQGGPSRTSSAMDVWFLYHGTVAIGHITVDESAGERRDVVLAVKTVDFIRARMFESLSDWVGHARSEASTSSTGQGGRAAPKGQGTTDTWHLGIGVAGLASFGHWPSSTLPVLELGASVKHWLRLSLLAGGLGTDSKDDVSEGSYAVRQQLLLATASALATPHWQVQPWAGAGLGLYHAVVHGVGGAGYVGHDVRAWSPAGRLTAGLRILPLRHISIEVGASALLLFRQPQIFAAGREVESAGLTVWLGHAMLGVSF